MNTPSTNHDTSKILVGICTCASATHRQQAVRETWMKRKHPGIECKFFTGATNGLDKTHGDTIYLNTNDDYDHLPQKVLAFFRYALEHHDFDWLFKCDDDTYLVPERLPDLLSPEFGMVGDLSLERRNAPSGGAGYLLSRQTVKYIAKQSDIPDIGYEDLIIGDIIHRQGIPSIPTARLNLNVMPYPMPHNNFISAHWCHPDWLRAIDTFFFTQPRGICRSTRREKNDIFQFYGNGYFRQESTGCAGRYVRHQKSIDLHWFQFPAEQLIKLGSTYIGSQLVLTPEHDRTFLDRQSEPAERSSEPICIQLGSGPNRLPGWINLDLPNFDITRPLPFADSCIDACFLEHVIEHVTPSQAYAFFMEAWRILKPGGILRLAFPDIGRISRLATPEYIRFLHERGWGDGTPGSAIRHIVVNHGHQSVCTEETLTAMLESLGYRVETSSPGHSLYPHLQGLEQHGSQIGEHFNHIETSCIDAIKPGAH